MRKNSGTKLNFMLPQKDIANVTMPRTETPLRFHPARAAHFKAREDP